MKRSFLLVVLVFMLPGVLSAQTTFYFPQIADGTFGGGFFKTTIFLANPASTGSVDITITFTTSAGGPFNVSFIDTDGQSVGSDNVIAISSLAAGQSRKLVSTAATPIAVGFATVTATAPIAATAIFSSFSGSPENGTLLSEAAVTASNTGMSQAIFVDENGFRTALAYANPSTTTPANLTFNLHGINTGGVPGLTTTIPSVAAMNHASLFVFELFRTDGMTYPLAVGHVGTMQIQSDIPVAIVSLRFVENLTTFTTVPPFSLASLILPIESWARPLESWMAARPWLSPLASLGRILGALRSSLG